MKKKADDILTDYEKVWAIRALYDYGFSMRKIAKLFDLTLEGVRVRLNETNNVFKKHEQLVNKP